MGGMRKAKMPIPTLRTEAEHETIVWQDRALHAAPSYI
jgi:hypothetical protein